MPSTVGDVARSVKDSADGGSWGFALGFVTLLDEETGAEDSSSLRDFHSSNDRNSSEGGGASEGKQTGSGVGTKNGPKGSLAGTEQMLDEPIVEFWEDGWAEQSVMETSTARPERRTERRAGPRGIALAEPEITEEWHSRDAL